MKKTVILLLLCLWATGMAAQQTQSPQMVKFLKEFPQRAAFNTHSYEFLPVKDTKAPKGYEAFYISHYGRHGSRSDWGGKMTYGTVVKTLQAAKDAGVQLTSAGDSLLKEASYVLEKYDGMDGRLTPRGVREHARLAQRMYDRFPSVFTKGSKHIRAVSSTSPRCLISMNGFTSRLQAIMPELEMDLDSGEKFMAYISKAENDSISKRTRKAMAARYGSRGFMPRVKDSVTVLKNLFVNPEQGKEYVKNVDMFQYCVFAVAKIAEANDINDNLFRYLPFDAVYMFHENNVLSAYLSHCNSEENGDLRMPIAKDLVDVLLSQADEVISGKSDKAADLCFGHDWPYLGLCSFLGLEGIGDRLSIEDAAAKWMASWNCPFAANLQMIFYRSKKADAPVLVKFLVNERETAIPALMPVAGPYYKWDDVKAFCETRLENLK